MGATDRRPLPGQPSTATITRFNDNRFGAVLSAIHGFWISRTVATARRDSYSVITFDGATQVRAHSPLARSRCILTETYMTQVQITNDFTGTPDELLARVVQIRAGGGTNFNAALASAQNIMDTHWSTDR